MKVDPDTAIFILRPFLRFERIQDEAILPVPHAQEAAITSRLLTAAHDAVQSRKLVIVDCQTQGQAEVALCNQLSSLSPRLSQGVMSDDIRVLLKRLASLKEHHAVLVNLLLVKVGPSGYWNPNTGQIGSAMSYLQLKAALIHCDTERVLWMNQVLLRQLPKIESPEF
jgi:hypothetical protein